MKLQGKIEYTKGVQYAIQLSNVVTFVDICLKESLVTHCIWGDGLLSSLPELSSALAAIAFWVYTTRALAFCSYVSKKVGEWC